MIPWFFRKCNLHPNHCGWSDWQTKWFSSLCAMISLPCRPYWCVLLSCWSSWLGQRHRLSHVDMCAPISGTQSFQESCRRRSWKPPILLPGKLTQENKVLQWGKTLVLKLNTFLFRIKVLHLDSSQTTKSLMLHFQNKQTIAFNSTLFQQGRPINYISQEYCCKHNPLEIESIPWDHKLHYRLI